MEPVRFADILFILLVCAVTFGILFLVNRKRTSGKNSLEKDDLATADDVEQARPRTPDEE